VVERGRSEGAEILNLKGVSTDNVKFRRFDAETDSIDTLTTLLHTAYAEHLKAGRTFFASYQTRDDTLYRLSKGECWLAVDGDELVGTVTVVAPYDFPPGYPAEDKAGTFYQLAVLPQYQRKGLGESLLRLAEERIVSNGCETVTIDTSELATELIAWYKKRGYAYAGAWNWSVTNYPSTVLTKRLGR
jgi:ribosomal protein S18 acetylase RimI-like enzyme